MRTDDRLGDRSVGRCNVITKFSRMGRLPHFLTYGAPRVAFGLPYLLIELFNTGIPIVRTDDRLGDRSVGRCNVITKFSRMGRLPHFLTYGAPLPRFACESSAIKNPADKNNVSTHFDL